MILLFKSKTENHDSRQQKITDHQADQQTTKDKSIDGGTMGSFISFNLIDDEISHTGHNDEDGQCTEYRRHQHSSLS